MFNFKSPRCWRLYFPFCIPQRAAMSGKLTARRRREPDGQRLNEARNGIQTQTGASTYTINERLSVPARGDNQLLNQVSCRRPKLPRIVRSLSRSRRAQWTQYRLNGIILPEASACSANRSTPGYFLDDPDHRALPAEYGLRTAVSSI